MTKSLYILILTAAQLISFSLFSQYSFDNNNNPEFEKVYESRNDSADLSSNFYDIYNVLNKKSHPADNIYKFWNTSSIKYRDDSLKVELDSIRIILRDLAHDQNFVHPIEGKKTSGFGYRRHRFHYGTDIDVITGDPIYCAFDGMVRVTTYDKGYGKLVVVRHENGLETVYAHLSKIYVDSNTVVKAGDMIGLGGNTGRSTGSHLHFEIRYLGIALNPEAIIDFKKFQLKSDTIFLTPASVKYLHQIAASKNAKYHYIRSGDTLSAIARKYRTSVSKICYYNGIRQTTVLQIGRKLRVR